MGIPLHGLDVRKSSRSGVKVSIRVPGLQAAAAMHGIGGDHEAVAGADLEGGLADR
jgi:hypothetical protein